MAVVISDVIAGKILVQLGWAQPAPIRAALAELDARPGPTDLIGHLRASGLIDGDKALKVRKYVDLYDRVRREAMYMGLIERTELFPKNELDRLRARLEVERYTRRLGEILVAEGKIGAATEATLRAQQTQGIERENVRLLETYRKTKFEGVARPITKNPRAKLETGVFTIKNLFRSQESQRLARLAAESPAASPGPSTPGGSNTQNLAVPTPQPKALPVGIPHQVGPYFVERVLGRGGMGIVLQAVKTGEQERVAIKLALAKDDEVKQRLRREILATSMVAHENIVQVLDAGETPEGSPYLVMELVKGRELRDLLKDRGSFHPKAALAIFVQLLGALGAAHRAGVIHRDVKPENLLVIVEGTRLTAKVMDFGLARITELDPEHREKVFQTMATDVVSGSPQYLAPEQVLGDQLDGRTDLYAAGVLLFELLTGQLPITGETMNDVIRGTLRRPPRKLSEAKPGGNFPPALEALVAAILAKAPDQRPPDADAILERVETEVLPALVPGATLDPERRSSKALTRVLERLEGAT